MAVAFDAESGSGSWNTATTDTRTHTPVGTPRGILTKIVQGGSSTDQISGVTYGGTAMTRIRFEQRTAGEPGAVYDYFLGASIPTGAQDVAATSTGTTPKSQRTLSVTAGADTEMDVENGGNGLAADPSLSISPTAHAVIGYGLMSGLNSPPDTPESGTTQWQSNQDLGSKSAMFGRKELDAGATTIGWTANSDDFCHTAIAVMETASGVETVTLAGTLPALTADVTITANSDTSLAGMLPSLTADVAVEASSDTSLAGVLPAVAGDFTVAAEAAVALVGTLPALVGDFTIVAAGVSQVQLAGTLPALAGDLTVTSPPEVNDWSNWERILALYEAGQYPYFRRHHL